MNRRIILLIISALLVVCMLITGCSSVSGSLGGNTGGTETTPSISVSSSDSDVSAAYTAYLEVLEENSDAIRSYWWQYAPDNSCDYFSIYEYGDIAENPENKCVAFRDLNGDGIPEMLFMSYESNPVAFLHIYTYRDGKAAECKCSDTPYTSNNWDTILADYSIAAGVEYMVYTGNEDRSFYIATREGDAYSSYTITKYSISDDASLDRAGAVHNRYESYGDENETSIVIDDYDIDGSPVSSEEGVAAFKIFSDNYDQLIMCAGYNEEMKVFELVKTDPPLAMKYYDAVEYARSRI